TSVRENFIAGLHAFTGQVMKENKDGYQAEVKKYQAAGQPIIAAMQKDVDEAVVAYEAAQAAQFSSGSNCRYPVDCARSCRSFWDRAGPRRPVVLRSVMVSRNIPPPSSRRWCSLYSISTGLLEPERRASYEF
ncbi:MAG: hypothetical protein ABID84_05185, partial [Chloroflexota bacterium]